MSPTPTNAEGLAKWLKQLRKKAGLSQEDTAAALKTSRRNVVRWESTAPTEPGALMLLRMLSLYGVRIEPAPNGYAPADVASVIEAIADQIAELQRQVIAAIARERAEQPPRDGGASLPHEAVER